MEHAYDVTIVGAGMAGLAAADKLSAAGLRTLILDKGRQVGGRMATRRMESGAFDTGAQFFTAVSPEFRALVERAAADGAVTQWYQRPPRRPGEDPLPVWCGSAGMTDLPKWIARDVAGREAVDLQNSTRAARIELTAGEVLVFTEASDARPIRTKTAILTPPAPQALGLLPRNLQGEIPSGIAELDYDPCLALLIALDSPLSHVFNENGWIRPSGSNETLAWAADNTKKGLPDSAPRQTPRITIHSTGEAARRWYEKEESQLTAELVGAFMELVPADDRDGLRRALAQGATNLKRWRYARPRRRWRELSVAITPEILLAGDSFGGGRVEGAFVSGRHAAGRILERID